MSFQEQLDSLFLSEEQIPTAFKLAEEVNQREYLSNGEMLPWSGDVHTVLSPICIKTENGLERKIIGTYPLCEAKEATAALDAAVAAYNNGRGEWPTMSVAKRIECVEKFTHAIIEKKQEVVKLIMWEIGKTFGDSTKEFDRTIEYIQATIDALKDLDRQSSGFTMEQGIVAQVRRSPLGVVLC
ncbi:MAG: aldehyde dehydrogenase family protein, partial [Pedobacter sp.]